MNATKKLKLVEPDTVNDLETARAARAEAEIALRAATSTIDAIVALWPAPNNQRSFIRSLYMRPAAANDFTLSETAREVSKRLEAFRAAEAAEDKAERELDAAIRAETLAVKVALGDGRGALAEAIAAARARVAEADAARATAERARGALVKARMVHDQAEAALADAREAAIDAATAAEGVQPVGLKDLRRAAADAADDVDIATEAVRRAEAATVGPEAAERQARAAIEAAARAVMGADVPQRIAEADAAIHDFKCRMFARAYYLSGAAPTSYGFGSEDASLRRRADALVNDLARFGQPIQAGTNPFPSGDQLFEDTLAGLMVDATTPLPEFPDVV